MRHLCFAIAALFAATALAQEPTPINPAQVKSGAVVRSYHLNTSGAPAPWYPSAPTFEIDFSTSPPGDGSTFAANTGQTLTQRGAPSRVTDGTWPSGLSGAQGYGWKFDGTDDYITSTIGPPAGDFSVMCVLGHNSDSASIAIGNSGSGAQGWFLYKNSASGRYDFYISDDGSTGAGHYSYTACACGAPIAGQSIIVATYNYTTDGASEGRIYCNEYTTCSSNTMDGPVYSGASGLSIGAYSVGGGYFNGLISHCAIFDGTVLTEAQARAIIRGWRGLVSSSGDPLSVSSATPPAIMLAPANSGTEPFLVNMPANSSQIGSPASGSGGLYGARSVTNLVQRSSFETWASGAPAGWIEATTSTGDCAQNTTHKAHSVSSAACTLADADDAVTLTSACLTVTGSTAYYLSAYLQKISGTANVNIMLIEDDSADCGSPTTTTTVVSGASPGTAWEYHGGSITTQASTIRAQVRIALPAAAAQSVAVDAVSLHGDATIGATALNHFCGADTDASAACTSVVPTDSNWPVGVAGNGSWTIDLVFRTPSVPPTLTSEYAIRFDGNGGDVSMASYGVIANIANVIDAASGVRYFYLVGFSTNTDFSARMGIVAGGNAGHYRVGTSNNTSLSGAGTGIVTSTSGTIYFGGYSTSNGGNMWVRDIVLYRRYLP